MIPIHPNRKLAQLFLVLTILVTAQFAFMGTAAAHHNSDAEDNPIDEYVHANDQDDEDKTIAGRIGSLVPETASLIASAINGNIERASGKAFAMNPFAEPETNADHAADFRKEFNRHSRTYKNELNANVNSSKNYDVHELAFSGAGSPDVHVYVVAEVVDGDVTEFEALTEDEFNQRNRTIDEHWVADGEAPASMDALAREIASRIQNNQDLGTKYQANLIGRHCDIPNPVSRDIDDPSNCDIRSTLWMPKEEL